MLNGIFQHIYLLFTFKHTGGGLKSSKETGMFLAVLSSIVLLPRILIPVEAGGVSLVSFFISAVIPFLILYFVSNIERANALNLTILAFNMLGMLIILLLGVNIFRSISLIFLIWQCFIIYNIYKKIN